MFGFLAPKEPLKTSNDSNPFFEMEKSLLELEKNIGMMEQKFDASINEMKLSKVGHLSPTQRTARLKKPSDDSPNAGPGLWTWPKPADKPLAEKKEAKRDKPKWTLEHLPVILKDIYEHTRAGIEEIHNDFRINMSEDLSLEKCNISLRLIHKMQTVINALLLEFILPIKNLDDVRKSIWGSELASMTSEMIGRSIWSHTHEQWFEINLEFKKFSRDLIKIQKQVEDSRPLKPLGDLSIPVLARA